MNLNPETTVHDDMYTLKYRQPDNLYETVLFEPLKQIRVSHAMFKVTSFVDFRTYLMSFNCLEGCFKQLEKHLTDIITNPTDKPME